MLPRSFFLAAIGLGFTIGSAMAQQRQVPSTPVPQPSGEVLRLCKSAEGLIEDALKSIAYETFSGILDNSAPRETTRQLKIVAATTSIQIQQAHMQSLGCYPFPMSISHAPFAAAALACSLAKGEEAKEKCDRKTWARAQTKAD